MKRIRDLRSLIAYDNKSHPPYNWIETESGKSGFTIMRIYSPLQPWIDQTWRPSEIE